MEYLVDPKYEGIKRRFTLLLKNDADRTRHAGYYLLKVEIKDYNDMIIEMIKNMVAYLIIHISKKSTNWLQ